MKRTHDFGHGLPIARRLGLATRGNTRLDPDDVHHAVSRGINYLNWCGNVNGLSRAVREMCRARKEVVLAWQIQSELADGAYRELDEAMAELGTDWIDIVTFYYVESEPEWCRISFPAGTYRALAAAREDGRVRMIGMTSHQRPMAARIAAGDILPNDRIAPGLDPARPLDMLMLRYNAAHQGAEADVFPITDRRNIPVVVYTCLRWGALLKSAPEDPLDFSPPPAQDWYRYALAHPSVAVALAAPNGREELDHDQSWTTGTGRTSIRCGR